MLEILPYNPIDTQEGEAFYETSKQAMHPNLNPNIETQDTQPLPLMPSLLARKPSLRELRLSCRMSREHLSQRAGVRLCRVDWMERGIETDLSDVLKVLLILSRAAQYWYHIEDIRGLRIKTPSDNNHSFIKQ